MVRVVRGVAVVKKINMEWICWTVRLFYVMGEEGHRMLVSAATVFGGMLRSRLVAISR
jgi:hypothetical protein